MGVLPVHMSAHQVSVVFGSQKRVLELLEMELQMTVNYHVGTGY